MKLLGPTLPARDMPAGLYAGVLLTALIELSWAIEALETLGDTPAQAASRHLNLGQVQLPLNSLGAWALLAGMVAITVGCRTGRRWARYAAAVYWILPVAARPFPTSAATWTDLAYAAGFTACVIAYLFRSEAVEAYFTRSEQARSKPHAPVSHGART